MLFATEAKSNPTDNQTEVANEALKPFSMDGELGVLLTTGNTQTSSLNAKLASHHEAELWSNDYLAEALYNQAQTEDDAGQEMTETTAQRYYLQAQGNYKLTDPEDRLFIFGSFEDNRFGNFRYQSTLAAGWSQRVWDTDKSKFEYSIGPGYAYNENQEGETDDGLIVRGSLDYEWHVSETALFKQLFSTEYGSQNTKTRSETSLSAQLNGSLSMKLSFILDHNSDVEPDRENLDTRSAVTLVYNFF